MLTVEERINLRDRLIKVFLNEIVVCNLPNGHYKIVSSKSFNSFLNKNTVIANEYNLYISEFRSQDEALYCLTHIDDYTNHICPICKEYSQFYNMGHGYRITCGKNKCKQVFAHSEEADKKFKESMQRNYGVNYTGESVELMAKAKATKKDRYGDENYNNRKKAEETNLAKRKVRHQMQDPEVIAKFIQTMLERYGVKWALQHPKIVETWRKNYEAKHGVINPTTLEECQPLLDQIKKGLTLAEVYSNNEYFKYFTILSYLHKNRLLLLSETMHIFNKSLTTIGKRISKLGLSNYYDIQESELELFFMSYLIEKKFKNKIDFIRRKYKFDKDNHKQQIDFQIVNYNIAFEINDICSHNITRQESTYHIHKTQMMNDQYNIRLIHLWEWELTNDILWLKISNWIFNSLFNQSKVQLNLFDNSSNNYDIKLVDKKEQLNFLNQYSLDNNREFIKCIGIYYDNKLIQTISFVNDRIISICVKFGYEMIKGTKEIILQSYMKYKNLDYILTYIDLSKFTGKTFKDIGFELIQYQEPNLIAEDSNVTSKYKQMYNCGYNVYMMTL